MVVWCRPELGGLLIALVGGRRREQKSVFVQMFEASISSAISFIGAELELFCHLLIYAWFANVSILFSFNKHKTNSKVVSELTGPVCPWSLSGFNHRSTSVQLNRICSLVALIQYNTTKTVRKNLVSEDIKTTQTDLGVTQV